MADGLMDHLGLPGPPSPAADVVEDAGVAGATLTPDLAEATGVVNAKFEVNKSRDEDAKGLRDILQSDQSTTGGMTFDRAKANLKQTSNRLRETTDRNMTKDSNKVFQSKVGNGKAWKNNELNGTVTVAKSKPDPERRFSGSRGFDRGVFEPDSHKGSVAWSSRRFQAAVRPTVRPTHAVKPRVPTTTTAATATANNAANAVTTTAPNDPTTITTANATAATMTAIAATNATTTNITTANTTTATIAEPTFAAATVDNSEHTASVAENTAPAHVTIDTQVTRRLRLTNSSRAGIAAGRPVVATETVGNIGQVAGIYTENVENNTSVSINHQAQTIKLVDQDNEHNQGTTSLKIENTLQMSRSSHGSVGSSQHHTSSTQHYIDSKYKKGPLQNKEKHKVIRKNYRDIGSDSSDINSDPDTSSPSAGVHTYEVSRKPHPNTPCVDFSCEIFEQNNSPRQGEGLKASNNIMTVAKKLILTDVTSKRRADSKPYTMRRRLTDNTTSSESVNPSSPNAHHPRMNFSIKKQTRAGTAKGRHPSAASAAAAPPADAAPSARAISTPCRAISRRGGRLSEATFIAEPNAAAQTATKAMKPDPTVTTLPNTTHVSNNATATYTAVTPKSFIPISSGRQSNTSSNRSCFSNTPRPDTISTRSSTFSYDKQHTLNNLTENQLPRPRDISDSNTRSDVSKTKSLKYPKRSETPAQSLHVNKCAPTNVPHPRPAPRPAPRPSMRRRKVLTHSRDDAVEKSYEL